MVEMLSNSTAATNVDEMLDVAELLIRAIMVVEMLSTTAITMPNVGGIPDTAETLIGAIMVEIIVVEIIVVEIIVVEIIVVEIIVVEMLNSTVRNIK